MLLLGLFAQAGKEASARVMAPLSQLSRQLCLCFALLTPYACCPVLSANEAGLGVRCMSWSPGGDLLAVGGYDQVRPVPPAMACIGMAGLQLGIVLRHRCSRQHPCADAHPPVFMCCTCHQLRESPTTISMCQPSSSLVRSRCHA
jgi:hypothetical protein